MAAKLVLVLGAVLILVVVMTVLTFLYFERRAERKHEREMFREQRDAEILDSIETDPIDRELERESDDE